ncbi:MAG TPA: hypothetical protein VE091_06285 [Gemmatimonadales bacterium]|nr:hypothetical protein [Gemmatimonadales bacterium]
MSTTILRWGPYGAAHTLEIHYRFPLYHGAQGVPKRLNAAQEQLSQEMVSYWTKFAASAFAEDHKCDIWDSLE